MTSSNDPHSHLRTRFLDILSQKDGIVSVESFLKTMNEPENEDLLKFIRSEDCKTQLETYERWRPSGEGILSPFTAALECANKNIKIAKAILIDLEFLPVEELLVSGEFRNSKSSNNKNNNDDDDDDDDDDNHDDAEDLSYTWIFAEKNDDNEKIQRLRQRIKDRVNEEADGTFALGEIAQLREHVPLMEFLLSDVVGADPNKTLTRHVYESGTNKDESKLETQIVSPFRIAITDSNPAALRMLLKHPKFVPPSLVEIAKIVRDDYVEVPMMLKILQLFPRLSLLPRTDLLSNCIFDKEYQENEFEDEDSFDDYPDFRDPNVDILGLPSDENEDGDTSESDNNKNSPPVVLSATTFFGHSNPTRLGLGPKWVQYAMDCTRDAYSLKREVNRRYHPKIVAGGDIAPAWCYHRFGCAVVVLNAEKGMYLFIGGQHEDSYDPDFAIFNDCFVFDASKRTYEMFAYPREVFPPTDNASATMVPSEGKVYLFGNFGYPTDRRPEYCQVFRLDLVTMKMERVETNNDDRDKSPGWVRDCVSWIDEAVDPNVILISGGKSEAKENNFDPTRIYRFDLKTQSFV